MDAITRPTQNGDKIHSRSINLRELRILNNAS